MSDGARTESCLQPRSFTSGSSSSEVTREEGGMEVPWATKSTGSAECRSCGVSGRGFITDSDRIGGGPTSVASVVAEWADKSVKTVVVGEGGSCHAAVVEELGTTVLVAGCGSCTVECGRSLFMICASFVRS